MGVWLLAGLYVALLCIAAVAARPFDTYLSPVTITGFAGFFYLVGIPVEIGVTGVPYLRLDRNILISESAALEVAALAVLAFVSWFAGYWFAADRTRRVQDREPLRSEDTRIVKRALMLVALGGAVVLLTFYPAQLIAAHDYASQFGQRYSLPGFSLLIAFTGVALGMLGFLVGWERPRGWIPAVVIAVGLVAWGFYSNGKDPIVVAGLSLTGLYVRRWLRFRSAGAFVGVVSIGLVGTAVGTLFFSVFRGGSTDISAQLHSRGLLVGVEPAGPFYSIMEQLSARGSDNTQAFGQSVLNGLVSWVPRALWPGRPEDLGITFARAHIDNWSPGRGYGYSPLSEGLLNGGTIGVVVLFALIGVLIGLMRNLLLAPTTSGPVRLAALAFYAVYLMEQCFILFRGPFSLLVTNLVQGLGFFLLVMVAVGIAKRWGGDSTRERQRQPVRRGRAAAS